MTILDRVRLSIMLLGFFFLLALFSSTPTFAQNLLNNSDFETFDGASFTSWSKNVSTLSLFATQSGEMVRTGNQSAVLTSSTNSTKYLYQVIPASPSVSYHLSGWTKLIKGEGGAYLRVSQCKTQTCSATSEEIKSHDSTHVDSSSGSDLSLDFTTATNAMSLKVKLSLDPKSATETALIWDSIQMELIESVASSSANSESTASSTSSGGLATVPFNISYIVPATVSAMSPFSVSVIISGAIPSTSYFVKTLGGVSTSSADLRSISTINGLGSAFLAWNGSWTSMPIVTTDASGSASLTVQSRFNSTSTIGDNLFLVRIRKSDTETNLDGQFVAINVLSDLNLVDSGEEQNPDDKEDIINNGPTITLSSPTSGQLAKVFTIGVKASGLSGNKVYSYKARLGKSSSSMTKGATLNDDELLSDGSSWSKFPTFITNDGGTWEGDIRTIVKDGNEEGDYFLVVRVKDMVSGKLVDSASKMMKITISSEQPDRTVEEAIQSGEVLGATISPLSFAPQEGIKPPEIIPAIPSEVLAYATKDYDFGGHLISMGLFLLGSSFLWSVKILTNNPL